VAPGVPEEAPEPQPTLTPEQVEAEKQARVVTLRNDAAAEWDKGAGARSLPRVISTLREALELDSSSPETWYNLGLALAEQGDTAGSAEAFRRAESIDRQFMRGKAYEGFVLLSNGDVAGAEALFKECIEKRENEPGCNINLAILYARQMNAGGRRNNEMAQKAVLSLRFALTGEALNAAAYVNLARIYQELGRIELARLVCENAIQLGIDVPALHNRLGLIALAQRDVIAAYREFQTAAKADPKYFDANMNIGAMALNFRDFQAARGAFQAALEVKPDDVEARRSLAVSLRGLGDADAAEREYRALLERDANDIKSLYNLGVLQQELRQDYRAAQATFERVRTLGAGQRFERLDDVTRRLSALQTLIEFQQDAPPPTVEEPPADEPPAEEPAAEGSGQ
jgi:Flp pilus assembly protein TadD